MVQLIHLSPPIGFALSCGFNIFVEPSVKVNLEFNKVSNHFPQTLKKTEIKIVIFERAAQSAMRKFVEILQKSCKKYFLILLNSYEFY